MSNYRINLIPFKPTNQIIEFAFSNTEFEGSQEIERRFLPKGYTLEDDLKTAYFQEVQSDGKFLLNAKHKLVKVDFNESFKFGIYFFTSILVDYFENKKRFILSKGFINEPQIFIRQTSRKHNGFDDYKKYSIRVLTNRFRNNYSLLISFDGFSYFRRKNIEEERLEEKFINKVLFEKSIISYSKLNQEQKEQSNQIYPGLNRILEAELGIERKPFRNENKYLEYYNNISSFVFDHIDPDILLSHININSLAFQELSKRNICFTSTGSNLLEFGNGGFNFSPYHGIKENGPFKKPKDSIKLIFIFHKDDKSIANKLYSVFKKGYKSFPGLYEFIKIPVDIDTKNSIQYESENNPLEDIRKKLEPLEFDNKCKYAALYISRIDKNELNIEKHNQYYKIKELLLKHDITSQVILKNNIENEYFNFYLPNIAIALLAKLDGIPWRLKRPIRNDLLIGIGAYKPKELDKRYLGNAFFFKNDGTFHEFDCFEAAALDKLKEAYKKSITQYINEFELPDRLVIHFFKTISKKEVSEIQKILLSLNLSIPIVIITIGKNESRDFVLFDTDYDGMMPVSGTYMRLSKFDYLLCNNSRYAKQTGAHIDGFPFPIKLKFFSTNESLILDEEVIKELRPLQNQLFFNV
jgi:hypothetical protein